MLDRELMESPPIIPIGEYDTKKRHFQQEAHKEMLNFLERVYKFVWRGALYR